MKLKFLLGLLLSCLVGASLFAADTKARKDGEQGEFLLTYRGHKIPVFYFKPASAKPDSPVVIAMHGFGRTAAEFFPDWISHCKEHGFTVIVPRLSAEEYPGEYYIAGGVLDSKGQARPREDWAFSAIDPIFDAVCQRIGSSAKGYILFGHSAGAQFVHRFLFLMPHSKLIKATLANAGWYTLPDFNKAYPYGLKGTPANQEDLARIFSHPLLLILGSEDTDPNSGLRHTPEADEQGLYRLARGRYFFSTCKEAAQKTKLPFAWKLEMARGLRHSDNDSIPYLVDFVFAK